MVKSVIFKLERALKDLLGFNVVLPFPQPEHAEWRILKKQHLQTTSRSDWLVGCFED